MASGLAGQGFDIDLLHGVAEERSIARLLCKATFEVKTDRKAASTGNVFVEYRQPTGRSGIDATTADYWIFKIPGRCLIIVETERLKGLALEALTRHGGKPIRGGDYDKYMGVLIPVEWLVNRAAA